MAPGPLFVFLVVILVHMCYQTLLWSSNGLCQVTMYKNKPHWFPVPPEVRKGEKRACTAVTTTSYQSIGSDPSASGQLASEDWRSLELETSLICNCTVLSSSSKIWVPFTGLLWSTLHRSCDSSWLFLIFSYGKPVGDWLSSSYIIRPCSTPPSQSLFLTPLRLQRKSTNCSSQYLDSWHESCTSFSWKWYIITS